MGNIAKYQVFENLTLDSGNGNSISIALNENFRYAWLIYTYPCLTHELRLYPLGISSNEVIIFGNDNTANISKIFIGYIPENLN